MGRDSKRDRKRRGDDESDEERDVKRDRRSRSSSAPKEKRRPRSRSSSPQQQQASQGGGASESLSIAETNRLRAQLGLAPLEVDDGPKVRDAEDGTSTDKIVKEDGMEFRHRKADNWGDKKKDTEIKDKIEVAKQKRKIYEKVLKSKGLADEDSDDDSAAWVNKMRKQEEEKKKAEERAKMLDAMDEEFGVGSMIEDEKAKQARKKKRAAERTATGGLVVGHGKEAFLSGQDQILVLEDKGVLDDGDEVLVNPNLIDNERANRNVELKKRKGARDFDEDLDEWGNPKDYGLLAKYDEELEGAKRDNFRLDESGNVDLEREREEAAMRRRLMMAGKTLVTLDDSNKFNRASEFYTNEEMIAFRKVKKEKKDKKLRKRKEKGGGMLKADDLIPDEPVGKNMGSRNTRRRVPEEDEEEMETTEIKKEVKEPEDGELDDEMPVMGAKWKKTAQGAVDLDALKRVVEKELEAEGDDDSDEDLVSGVNLNDVVLDDDAEDELASILDKARRLKQMQAKKDVLDPEAVAKKVHDSMNKYEVKMEVDDDAEPIKEEVDDGMVMIDSTMEYCRNIGEIPTYGLAGNREDAIDMDDEIPEGIDDDEAAVERLRSIKEERQNREKAARETRGGWTGGAGPSKEHLDSDDEEALQNAEDYAGSGSENEDEKGEGEESDDDGPRDVLGGEIDASKGVGAMLKLAAKKGYLAGSSSKVIGENLDHLKNKRFMQMESAKYEMDDKHMKKLEKMGTTGRGPTMDFCEKRNYKPEVNIQYVDEKGRDMDCKDAFRKLSWKFHGKGPGKKQFEKRMKRMDQKDMLKKFHSSSDTPLGTLARQQKKQEQLQTPYLVLSGNASHSNFKKKE